MATPPTPQTPPPTPEEPPKAPVDPVTQEITEFVTELKEDGVPSNFADVDWPHDEFNISLNIKAEVNRSAGDMNGQKDKYLILAKALYVSLAHIKNRYIAQVADNEFYAKNTQDDDTELLARASAEKARRAALLEAQAEVDRLTAAKPKPAELRKVKAAVERRGIVELALD